MSKTMFEFFGLRENPFKINPDPRFMFLTPEARAASDELIYGIQQRKGLILLTGEVGTGKTMLVRHLLNWLSEQKMPTALIFNARLSSDNLLDFVLNDFGIPCKSSIKSDKLISLNNWLLQRYREDRIPVLIVDEAQGLPIQVLEEIRLLLNFETPRDKLLQIVLSGQPELNDTLKHHELRQLRQRITIRCKTSPLSFEQTHGYVHERLSVAGAKAQIFAADSMAYLYSYSRGVPRVINVLCERALMNAFADDCRLVRPQDVELAAEDSQLEGIDSISRVLRSGSTTTSLGSIEAILAGVSEDNSYGGAENRSRAPRSVFRMEPEAAAAEPVFSERSFPSSGYPEFTAKSDRSFPAQTRATAHDRSKAPEINVDTSFAQSAADARRPVRINLKLEKITSALDAALFWLRGWSRSFSADVRATSSQMARRMEFARLRYWLPLRRRLRHGFERLQDSAMRFASDPRWNQWRAQISGQTYKVFEEFRAWTREKLKPRSGTPANPPSGTMVNRRRVASLRHWLQRPMERRSHPPRGAASRGQSQNDSPQL